MPDYLLNKVAGPMPQAYNFIKKEALSQVFSCEFCKCFKNTFFTEHNWASASAHVMDLLLSFILESVSVIIVLI